MRKKQNRSIKNILPYKKIHKNVLKKFLDNEIASSIVREQKLQSSRKGKKKKNKKQIIRKSPTCKGENKFILPS